MDLANTSPQEAIIGLKEAQKQIVSLPPKSALILTDVTNTKFTRASSEAMKDFALKNTPHVKASAVVGAAGLHLIFLSANRRITQRNIKTFISRDEAKDWLIAQNESDE